MFHFPTFPPHALCVQARVTPHDWCGVPPFGNPRINARLTAPRGLSQPPTSFIGSWCQGIHRAPLKTWPHKNRTPTPGRKQMCGPTQTLYYRVRRCSRPLCSSQRTTRHRPHVPARPGTPTGDTAVREAGRPCRDPRTPVTRGSPLSQDPTACLRTGPCAQTPIHAHPKACSTGSPRREPAELVSVPPLSSTLHATPATRD
jgi:hypothetical protein